MRYKEFKNAVGDWGRKYDYKPIIKINGYSVLLKMTINGKYKPMVRISNIDSYALDTNYLYFNDLANDAKQDLYKIVTELAATKPEEREDKKVKKYKFKHKFLGTPGNDYLTYYTLRNRWLLLCGIETSNFKVEFTIDELKEKFNSNLDEWEIIEVE